MLSMLKRRSSRDADNDLSDISEDEQQVGNDNDSDRQYHSLSTTWRFGRPSPSRAHPVPEPEHSDISSEDGDEPTPASNPRSSSNGSRPHDFRFSPTAKRRSGGDDDNEDERYTKRRRSTGSDMAPPAAKPYPFERSPGKAGGSVGGDRGPGPVTGLTNAPSAHGGGHRSGAGGEAAAPTAAPATAQALEAEKPRTKEFWLTEMNRNDTEITAAKHELVVLFDRRRAMLLEMETEKRVELERERRGGAENEDKIDGQANSGTGVESIAGLIRRVYTENREKCRSLTADAGHAAGELANPMYRHMPEKHPAVRQVMAGFESFRPHLQAQIAAWRAKDTEYLKQLGAQYAWSRSAWARALRDDRSTSKQAAAEQRRREIFELSFPVEVRSLQRLSAAQRQRPNLGGEAALREGILRSLDDSKSGAGSGAGDGVGGRKLNGLGNLNDEDIQYHLIATCPPMLIGHARRLAGVLHDRNGLVGDSMKEHLENEKINIWTDEEKSIFFDRFMVCGCTKWNPYCLPRCAVLVYVLRLDFLRPSVCPRFVTAARRRC